MKKLLLVLAVLALLPMTASATTIVNSDYLIGTVIPGTPAGDVREFDRLAFFVQWYNTNTEPTPPDDNAYVLDVGSAVPGAPLPVPESLGATKTIWSSNMFTLPSGFLYMMVKFGENSAYYYIGGLSGELELVAPASFGTQGIGVSHVDLFNPGTTEVPEPASMLLLGTGVLGLASLMRRRR